MIHLEIIANIISCWNFIKIFEQNLSIQTYRRWKNNMSTRQKCSSDQKIIINNMTVQCWGDMFGLDEEAVMQMVGNIVWIYRVLKLKSWLRKFRVIYTSHAKLVLSFIYIKRLLWTIRLYNVDATCLVWSKRLLWKLWEISCEFIDHLCWNHDLESLGSYIHLKLG